MNQIERAITADILSITESSERTGLASFGAGTADLLIECLPAGVYLCDAAGCILRFNRRAAELWGRSPRVGDSDERFCGALRLFWPDGRPLPHEKTPMAHALHTGEPACDLEVQIERPDGSRIWASVNIVPLKDEQGKVLGAINCFQDITERKRAEDDLRRSREFLTAVFETTPECIKLVADDGRLLQINAAGLSAVEAETPDMVLDSNIFDVIAPECREEWREKHRRVCAGESLNWEFDIIGRRGTRRSMETHATPLRMPDGTCAQLSVTRDVTRRNKDEQALRESEGKLRSLLQALPMAVYTTDAEGRITFFNEAAAELWGRRPEVGDHWCGSARLFDPAGSPLPLDQCPMAIALKEKRPIRNVEAVLERPDGTRVPFMPYPTPLWDSDGRLVGAVNMLVDISYHKEAAARQTTLINELNHRVKNMLVTVQSIAGLTMRNSASPAQFRDAFALRISALSKAHDLLTSSKWQCVELRSLIEQELLPYAGRAGRIQLEGEPLPVKARQTVVLAMIIHELATNAAKYGALSVPHGRLAVQWVKQGADVHIHWIESGGPPVEVPSHRGFGSTLIERSVRGELGGSIRLDYAADGLQCEIHVPMEEEQDSW